jgi:hypothetical protein
MRRYRGGYLSATLHPWPCLLFLLPLLVAYEVGVLWLGGAQQDTLRNGADTWLRWGLDAFGLHQLYWPPAMIIVVFLLWSWFRFWDRPYGVAGLCVGMAIESGVFAFGLLELSRELRPFLNDLGIQMNAASLATSYRDKMLGRIVTFVGAGIYEELLFRLLLFFILGCLFKLFGMPSLIAALLTTVSSAILFSVAHHIGPYGEPFNAYVLLFRTLAGLYFALLYQLRGFGIAVGTHACYDVLVGVFML